MNTLSWTGPFFNIMALLSVFVSLWIAGRLLPALVEWLRLKSVSQLFTRPYVKDFLWLAVGGLFTLPLLDVIRWLGNLTSVVFLPDSGSFTTALGIISPRVYSLFPVFLMVIVYGITIYLGRNFLSIPRPFTQIERIFILTSLASLIYNGILTIFSSIFSFQAPILNTQQNLGIGGYLLEILIGFAILALIWLGVKRILSRTQASEQ